MRHGFFAGIFILVFIFISRSLTDNYLINLDQTIYQSVFILYNPFITTLMKLFTELGSTPAIITAALITQYVLLTKQQDYVKGFFSLLALLGAWGTNELLKEYFQRIRPEGYRLIDITGYSFPSGHAMVSIAFYGMLAYLLYKYNKNPESSIRFIIPAALFILVFFIGLSRIYLGVHYPSDVIAGFAAGAAWMLICIIGLNITEKYYKKSSSF